MYKLTDSTSITRLSDNASIPADPANRDYAGYLRWLSEGNIPTPAFTPAEIIANAKAATNSQALAAIAAMVPDAMEAMLAVSGGLGTPPQQARIAQIKAAVAAKRALITP